MKDGRRFILRSEEVLNRALDYIAQLSLEPLQEVLVRPHQSRRSLAQNNLLHLWCRHVSKEYYTATGKLAAPEVWKIYFKRHFLGQEHIELLGKSWDETRHTSDLSVKEFSEFLNDIDHYCGSELHISLPHPVDMYDEAMRKAA